MKDRKLTLPDGLAKDNFLFQTSAEEGIADTIPNKIIEVLSEWVLLNSLFLGLQLKLANSTLLN